MMQHDNWESRNNNFYEKFTDFLGWLFARDDQIESFAMFVG